MPKTRLERILLGLCVSDQFGAMLVPRREEVRELVEDIELSRFADWCLTFHERHKEAPRHHVENYHSDLLTKKSTKKAGLERLEKFLSNISDGWLEEGEPNASSLMEDFERELRRDKVDRLVEELDDRLERDELDDVHSVVDGINLMGSDVVGSEIDPLSDEAVDVAYATSMEPMFRLKGALGKIVNPFLIRDSLLTILAPEKRGKSHCLNELAMRAAISRLNVAVFQVGDLSEGQSLTRQYQWMTRKNPYEEGEVELSVPDCVHHQLNTCPLENENKCDGSIWDTKKYPDGPPPKYEPCVQCRFKKRKKFYRPTYLPNHIEEYVERMTMDDVHVSKEKLRWRMKGRRIRHVTYHNSTVNVAEIDGVLKRWKVLEKWTPDVVLIDYADILKPEREIRDERAKHDERWKRMRRLSQEWSILLVTATQAGRQTYDSDMVLPEDQSEDKRKNSHVNGILCLHQTREEKAMGIMRIGWGMVREGVCDVYKQALTFQDLSRGQFHRDSVLINYRSKKK